MKLPSVLTQRRLVVFLAILGGVLPIALYASAYAGLNSLPASEAIAQRDHSPDSTLFVDIRDRETYDAQHIAGAVSWPKAEIDARPLDEGLPAALRGKHLIFYCDSGLNTALALRKVRRLGATDATMVRDGLAGFHVQGKHVLNRDELAPILEGTGPLPVRPTTLLDQWALFLTGYVVKPIYMVFSAVIIYALRRATHSDLAAVRWSMIFFLIGEAACAVNYLVFQHQSHLTEFIHSYSMVLTFGFLTYAILEGVDRRIIAFSDPEGFCAVRPICAVCHKKNEGVCGLIRLFKFLVPAMLVVAFLPLTFLPDSVSYNTVILGTPYNSAHPGVYQVYEARICPWMAVVLFGAAWVALLRTRGRDITLSKILFCAGVGALGFSLFRVTLLGTFRENLAWFNSWEEITEFILVAGIAVFLHTFRRGLFELREEHEVA